MSDANPTPRHDPDGEAVPALLSDFSLEMTGKDVDALRGSQAEIPPGSRINVTYLASEDLETRVQAAAAVRDLGFVPVPHISARRLSSQEELAEFLERLREVDATEQVFVVGGDPADPVGPYPDALSVIRSGLLEEHGVREVGIAGYPEGHPGIPDDVLRRHLEDKLEELHARGLRTVVVTQFGFDTDPVIEWIGQLRGQGVDARLRIGVPGPAGVKRLLSFARRFGIGANAMVVKKYGFSLTNLLGTAGPDRFLRDLASRMTDEGIAEGVSIHFYAFGGLGATAKWVRGFIEQEGGLSA